MSVSAVPLAAVTGDVDGVVWDDADRDGQIGTTEPRLENWTVYADVNKNGRLDANEPSTLSNADGEYTLHLRAGSYRIREVLQSGWNSTCPANGFYAVNVQNGKAVTGRSFGNDYAAGVGTISGHVFEDINGNKELDQGEPYLKGWTVYLDKNRNGRCDPNEPKQLTTSDMGRYEFSVAPGTYRVREIKPTGWRQTLPTAGYHTVTVAAGEHKGGNLFGNQTTVATGAVTGVVWDDADRDCQIDATESRLENWTVYADVNKNGRLDADEPSTVSNVNGEYMLHLRVGSYRIREVLQSGWKSTCPAGGFYAVNVQKGKVIADKLFGNERAAGVGTISGHVFNDINGNKAWDLGESYLKGWTVYLDKNRNGKWDAKEPKQLTSSDMGRYVFNVAPGTYRVRLVMPTAWRQTFPALKYHDVAVAAKEWKRGNLFGVQRIVAAGSALASLSARATPSAIDGAIAEILPDPDNRLA